MKIDWKHLASTAGYKSLMAAVTKDVQSASRRRERGNIPMRDKKEFMTKFRWAICRATHYSQHTGKPVHKILTEWESKRDYWWLNFYSDHNLPKLSKNNSLKPLGIRGARKYYHKGHFGNPKEKMVMFIRTQINSSKKRWDKAKKANAEYWRGVNSSK